MKKLCVVLSILVGILLFTTMKYKNAFEESTRTSEQRYESLEEQYNLLKEQYYELEDSCESLENQYESLVESYMELEEQYYTMEKEHDVIFSNLEQDPMYLVKAKDAHNELYNKLEGLGGDVLNVMQNANVLYNSTSENHYNRETKEITLSLFRDYNDEQQLFIYDYLNDRYGLNLDSSDVRTNMIFVALHELGHYVDYSNKEMTNEYDSYEELNLNQKEEIKNMEYGPEMWQAYRETPEEEFADRFAIDFMIKYFPELV